MSDQRAVSNPSRAFQTTDWSLVRKLQADESTARRLATARWVEIYSPALLAHLVCRMNIDRADAEELLQGFVAERILERSLLADADHTKGRLRSLLLKSLNRYVIDAYRRERTRERHVSAMAASRRNAADSSNAAERDVFSAFWAQRTLVEALQRMREELLRQDRNDLWEVFECRILRPFLFAGADPLSYPELVERFRFNSPKQAANAVITALRHFRRRLKEVAAEYVGENEADAELDDLRSILARFGSDGLPLPVLDLAGNPVAHGDADETDPAALAGFFVCSEERAPWREEEQSAVWAHQMRTPLRIELMEQDHMTGVDPPLATFEDLLQHPSPPLDLLQQAKAYAKRFLQDQPAGASRELATSLYFCCIAAALVRHRSRITSLEDSMLTAGLAITIKRAWISGHLAELLNQALALAEQPPISDG